MAKLCTVVNIHDLPLDWQSDPQYVYIGRRCRWRGGWLQNSPWANMFGIGAGGGLRGKKNGRAQAVRAFRQQFHYRLQYLDPAGEFRLRALALAGKVLVCWCKPKLCHGDVIAEYVNAHT